MAHNKAEFSGVYDKKLQELQGKLAAERAATAEAVYEIKEIKSRFEETISSKKELEATNGALQERLKELQDLAETQARQARAESAKKDHEIDYLNEQNDTLSKDFHDLLETKIALDMEIAAYRTLLEGEETRLGMSQSDEGSADLGQSFKAEAVGRGKKRKRMLREEEYAASMASTSFTQSGSLFIEPLDDEGKCIRVFNKGEEGLSLQGYKLSCTSEGIETIYPFGRSAKIEAGAEVAVWSCNAEAEHKPKEGQFVMKEGVWQLGEDTRLVLFDNEDKEVATRDTIKEEKLKFHGSDRVEELRKRYGMSGDFDDKNCLVM